MDDPLHVSAVVLVVLEVENRLTFTHVLHCAALICLTFMDAAAS